MNEENKACIGFLLIASIITFSFYCINDNLATSFIWLSMACIGFLLFVIVFVFIESIFNILTNKNVLTGLNND